MTIIPLIWDLDPVKLFDKIGIIGGNVNIGTWMIIESDSISTIRKGSTCDRMFTKLRDSESFIILVKRVMWAIENFSVNSCIARGGFTNPWNNIFIIAIGNNLALISKITIMTIIIDLNIIILNDLEWLGINSSLKDLVML